MNHSINEPYVPELPTNCKLCGGPLPEERAFWGKRFCSKSCGKKYNASHPLRVRRGYGKRGGTSGRGGRGRGYSKLRLQRVCILAICNLSYVLSCFTDWQNKCEDIAVDAF